MDKALRDAQDLVFLALVVWREARGESHECQVAVAHSILNRVQRPAWWGDSVLSVVTKKWQYSSMTDPRDVQLVKWPSPVDAAWPGCMEIARDVLAGATVNPVRGADGYYDVSIPPPKWATPDTFVRQIGRIRFYNLDHDTEVTGGTP